jgi:hypothetical protein
MSDKRYFRDKIVRGGRAYTEEELALEVSEDKRLVRLGIDPNLPPDELLAALRRKESEFNAIHAKTEEGDA